MASVWVRVETPGSDWDRVKGFLESAAARADVAPDILTDHQVLFVARRFEGLHPVAVGAATAGMLSDGSAEIVLFGGCMEAVRPTFETIKEMARQAGAKALLAEGRPGWARVLGWPVTERTSRSCSYRLELC